MTDRWTSGSAAASPSSPAAAAASAAELAGESGGCVLGVRADVDRSEDVAALAAAVEARFGRIDILVNCAGTHRRGTVDDAAEADVETQWRTKVLGCLRMTRAVLPAMRRRRDGRIVNVVGQAGRHVPGVGPGRLPLRHQSRRGRRLPALDPVAE